MIADSVAFLKSHGQGGRLRRRALLRRLPRRSARTRCAPCRRRRRRAPTGSCSATRTAAACPRWVTRGGARRCGRRSRARRSASTPTTTASWPWPTRWPRWRRAAPRCRARSTATASAAATRTSLRHPGPAAQDGAALRARRRAWRASPSCRARSRRSPTCSPDPHAALRRRLRLRPQGRRARGRGREGGGELRAHRRPSGWATCARSWSPSCPAAATCACARPSWASTCAGSEPAVLARVKELENRGYQFEAAEGSFELLVRRSRPGYRAAFEILDVVVIAEQRARAARCSPRPRSSCGRRTRSVHDGGRGRRPRPRARPRAAQGARAPLPELADVRLADYKVRILDPESATGAKTRVLIEAARGRGAVEHDRRLPEHHRGQRRGAGRQPGAAPPARGVGGSGLAPAGGSRVALTFTHDLPQTPRHPGRRRTGSGHQRRHLRGHHRSHQRGLRGRGHPGRLQAPRAPRPLEARAAHHRRRLARCTSWAAPCSAPRARTRPSRRRPRARWSRRCSRRASRTW